MAFLVFFPILFPFSFPFFSPIWLFLPAARHSPYFSPFLFFPFLFLISFSFAPNSRTHPAAERDRERE